MLDFRIGTFLKLCETRSYTKTAKLLHITQPSVTQHIKFLQKRYQCTLFTYEGKTLRLTPEGEYLRRHAETMNKASAKVLEDLKRMSSKGNTLRFGCPAALGDAAAQIIGTMLADDPEMDIQLTTTASGELIQMLESGMVDFTLADKKYAKPHFGTYNLGRCRISAYASPADAERLSGTGLKRSVSEKLIIREPGSGIRDVTEQLLADKGCDLSDFRSVMECNAPVSILSFTAAGLGISFAPDCSMREAVQRGQVCRITGSDFSADAKLEFMYLKDSISQDGCKPFFEKFKALWSELTKEEA